MNHIAIMKKSWGLLPKILSGEKKIESRWYLNKNALWGKIKKGDTVYFKNSKDDGIKRSKISNLYKLFRYKKYCLLIFLKNPKEIKPFNISKKGFGMMSAWLCVDDINKTKVKN